MSKKSEFIEFVKDNLMDRVNYDDVPENVRLYWEALIQTKEEEKPLFTENGQNILMFLQEHQDVPMWKSKEIADGLCSSSRMVAGAMRKLVSDGFVEKLGETPAIYSLTQKGKEVNFNNEGENE